MESVCYGYDTVLSFSLSSTRRRIRNYETRSQKRKKEFEKQTKINSKTKTVLHPQRDCPLPTSCIT